MRLYNILVLILVSTFTFSSCEDKKVNTAALKDELNARKIKKVKSGEIIAFAENKGKALLEELENMNATERDSLVLASHCLLKIATLDSIAHLTAMEKAVFEAYEYSFNEGSILPDNVQSFENDSRIMFSRATRIDSTQMEVVFIKFWRKYLVLEM